MHTAKVLHTLLSQSVPSIHGARLRALVCAVDAIVHGARANVTAIGRGLRGQVYDKHKIKRIDRLLSNPHLYKERGGLYRSIVDRLLWRIDEPIILIDWSPLRADQHWQLLGASVPLGGQSVTLYEEVHPQCDYGNRKVQHRFIDQIATFLPPHCRPIIVADGGFKTPFFRYIENQHHGHWLGRVRGSLYLRQQTKSSQWFSVKSIFGKATARPTSLKVCEWVKSHPLFTWVVRYRKPGQCRKTLNTKGQKRRCERTRKPGQRETDPWILVASLSLCTRTAKQIVYLYKTRMQIEPGFRDTKASEYGVTLSRYPSKNPDRRAILCLLVVCALFMLWAMGVFAKDAGMIKQIRINSSSKRCPYPVIFMTRLLIKQHRLKCPSDVIERAVRNVQTYLTSVLLNG